MLQGPRTHDFNNAASKMKAEEQNASTHTFMLRDCVMHCRRLILDAVLGGCASIGRYSRSTAARRGQLFDKPSTASRCVHVLRASEEARGPSSKVIVGAGRFDVSVRDGPRAVKR